MEWYWRLSLRGAVVVWTTSAALAAGTAYAVADTSDRLPAALLAATMSNVAWSLYHLVYMIRLARHL